MTDSSGSDQANEAAPAALRARSDANADGAVFISYASQDAAIAAALVEALERHGLACWIAPRDVKAGALYADAIVRAISSAKALVLVLSASAIASSHVGKEIERASSKKRPIIALRIDAAPLTPALEYFLSESQWVEAPAGNINAAYAKLIEAIHEPERPAPGTIGAVTRETSGGAASAPPPGSRRNRILLAAALAVAALALSALLADKLWLSKRAKSELAAAPVASAPPAATPAGSAISEKSIAVLPFEDLSEHKDQEYFSDGLSEDLIDLLTKVPELHVPARASSFYFRGQHATIAEIAKALSVAYVLEGSVRKAGGTIRVRTELIRADNGYNVWSETYDHDLKDVFKVQDEIAGRVVTALRAALPAAKTVAAGRTDNTDAYNQYLLGRNFQNLFTEEGSRHALEAYKRAIALDPHYAAAYSGLAFVEANIGDTTGDPSGITRAMAAAERAIALAPNDAAGYGVRGYLRTAFLWDWDGATQDFNRVVALDPNAELLPRSALAQAQGRLTDSIALMRESVRADPLVALQWSVLGSYLIQSGNLQEARAALSRALEIDPDYSVAQLGLAEADLVEGHLNEALAKAHEIRDPVWHFFTSAIIEQSLQHPRESQQALDALIKIGASQAAYQIAEVYAWRGEKEQAFGWLDRAYAQRDGGLHHLKLDPYIASLRADPRYGALLRKINLPE